MSVPKRIFWAGYLKIFSIFIILIGFYISYLNSTFLFIPMKMFIDPFFFPGGSPDLPTRNFQFMIYGLLGAAMVILGIFQFFIAAYPFKKGEKWASYCIIAAIAGWLCTDMVISVVISFWFNVIFNSIFLILWLLPVLAVFINERKA